MTKGERRKARKITRTNNMPLIGDLSLNLDNDNGPMEFGPERLRDGKINVKRERALQRYARFVYDRD